MSDRPMAKRPSRGVIWVNLTLGEPLGLYFAEWAHVTPRYPAGIKDSALKALMPDIQRETALFWFWANLKPYDLSEGGPYFTLGDSRFGGVGRVPFAPNPVEAYHALKGEFDGILADTLLFSIGESLGGQWMWIADPPAIIDPQSPEELRVAILATLDDLAQKIRQVGAGHGQIGHNGPPDDLPVSADEQTAAIKAIEDTKGAVAGTGPLDVAGLESAWSHVAVVAAKLGNWAAKQADTFVTGIVTEGGKAIGKSLPTLIVLAIGIWLDSSRAIDLIEMLIKKLP